MQPPRARVHIPPMGVFGAVTTAGRPLSPLSAARASPVAARRRGSSLTSPRLYPPTRRGRACAAAARAQHLGGPTSPASPSISFTWWVFDRRRAHPGSTRACARGRPDRVRVAGHRPSGFPTGRLPATRRPAPPPPPPAGGMLMALRASPHALRASPHLMPSRRHLMPSGRRLMPSRRRLMPSGRRLMLPERRLPSGRRHDLTHLARLTRLDSTCLRGLGRPGPRGPRAAAGRRSAGPAPPS